MSFTFHYVSILIDAELADIRVGAEFTFHYVSILIKTSIDLHLPDYVYIPLCLYFNGYWLRTGLACSAFTFHYVSILIVLADGIVQISA